MGTGYGGLVGQFPVPHRAAPLNAVQWAEMHDVEGRIADVRKLREIVFYGVRFPILFLCVFLCTEDAISLAGG